MRVFKCGGCQTPYKVEDSQIKGAIMTMRCKKCNAKNLLRFGVVLMATTKHENKTFVLKDGENIIGRNGMPEQMLSLTDKYVSRKHAVVIMEKRGSEYVVSISDCKSTNGTFNKNKGKLKPGLKYPFKPNDYFVVGLTKLSVTYN